MMGRAYPERCDMHSRNPDGDAVSDAGAATPKSVQNQPATLYTGQTYARERTRAKNLGA